MSLIQLQPFSTRIFISKKMKSYSPRAQTAYNEFSFRLCIENGATYEPSLGRLRKQPLKSVPLFCGSDDEFQFEKGWQTKGHLLSEDCRGKSRRSILLSVNHLTVGRKGGTQGHLRLIFFQGINLLIFLSQGLVLPQHKDLCCSFSFYYSLYE